MGHAAGVDNLGCIQRNGYSLWPGRTLLMVLYSTGPCLHIASNMLTANFHLGSSYARTSGHHSSDLGSRIIAGWRLVQHRLDDRVAVARIGSHD